MFVAGCVGNCVASAVAFCACSACQAAARETFRRSARLAYSVLFFLAVVVSWIMRDFSKPLLEKIPWIMRSVGDFQPSDKWFGQQAVYRLSFGNFLFFIFMSVALINVRSKSDKRDLYLQHGSGIFRFLLWLAFCMLPFFFPNSVVNAYGWTARFGSGLFLILQMIILLDFFQNWNDSWAAAGEDDERWLYGLLGLTVAGFAGTITLAGLMLHWFNPATGGSCSFNVAIITCTLLVCVGFSLLTLHPAARPGSLFPASCISLYCMYLCFSALQSEPGSYACNGLGKRITAASQSTLILGMLVTLVSVIYSAFRAGSNTQLFLLGSDGDSTDMGQPLIGDSEIADVSENGPGVAPGEVQATRTGGDAGGVADTPVTYNYSFFHCVFALASMYIAMLMTGWGYVQQDQARVDVGWTSVWVKLGAQWSTVLLYTWMLLAPALFPERDFS